MALAYRTNKAIAINKSFGVWYVYDLRRFDPVRQSLEDCPVLAKVTNRKLAIKLVKGVAL